jgi:hypothetical protein
MAVLEDYPDRAAMEPCPWCGALPWEKTRKSWNSVQAGYAFICGNLKCVVRPESEFHPLREVAKRRWNKRVEPPEAEAGDGPHQSNASHLPASPGGKPLDERRL